MEEINTEEKIFEEVEAKTLPSKVNLTNEERLIFENMELTRQNINLMIRNMNMELSNKEKQVTNMIKNRIGIDITGWQVALDKGIAINNSNGELQ